MKTEYDAYAAFLYPNTGEQERRFFYALMLRSRGEKSLAICGFAGALLPRACPAIEFSIHDPDSIYSDMEYPLPLSSKDRGDLELVPYYNEHPLVNEAIRQVEQLQKQQEKKKHWDVAR